MQLERLFIEGEQERIQKEKQEKKEAEQIAAGSYMHRGNGLDPEMGPSTSQQALTSLYNRDTLTGPTGQGVKCSHCSIFFHSAVLL